MRVIDDTLGRDRLRFYYAETNEDIRWIRQRFVRYRSWGMDTESTGLNTYQPGWQLRTFQFGRSNVSYVIPAKFKHAIERFILTSKFWIGHNGPHDIRSIDCHLGYETGVVCQGETYIPAHHSDPRNRMEGGIGHGLKEQAIALVSRDAGKWEEALKAEFKNILVPIEGEVFKSGPRKGQPKTRKARLAEGWGLIDPRNDAYIAYAASDPIITFRLWKRYRSVVRGSANLYAFDHRVQIACDQLQRRAIRLDTAYTNRLNAAFVRMAQRYSERAKAYGCQNIFSGQQIVDTLTGMGVQLRDRTATGKFQADNRVLRDVAARHANTDVSDFINCVLVAKQLLKRKESYTSAFLSEMDMHGRVHPSINSLAARTARMSVSRPALQQLPTKDRGNDLEE